MKTRFADEDLSGTVLAVPPPCAYCRVSDEDLSGTVLAVPPPLYCRVSDEDLSLTLSPRPCAPCFAPTMDEELTPSLSA
ncbi:MAG: hypothetical protein IH626_08940 [Rhodospirillales bacterium]|nr:hypothetical protein [Rhodospirillales bacterium]